MKSSRQWIQGFLVVCSALLVITLSVTPGLAQTFRGTILGSAVDESGASIVEAKVTARNLATGLERTTVTNSRGQYNLPELPIGTYKVTIEKAGFQMAVTPGLSVGVAAEKRFDAMLKPGKVSQEVVVSAEQLPQVFRLGTDGFRPPNYRRSWKWLRTTWRHLLRAATSRGHE